MNGLKVGLALASFLVAAWAQEPARKPGSPCDAAAVEDGLWCGKCRKLREKEQLADEKCKDCGTVPDKLKVCVKKWIPRCGMHNQQPHLKECCASKFCCKWETVKTPLAFRCEGCGQAARSEADLKHDAKDHEKKVVKSCEGSGTQPHGGEPIK